MSYIFITEPYISSYADIDVLLAIWRSGALHYYSSLVVVLAIEDYLKLLLTRNERTGLLWANRGQTVITSSELRSEPRSDTCPTQTLARSWLLTSPYLDPGLSDGIKAA
jgi:hypothetical protein